MKKIVQRSIAVVSLLALTSIIVFSYSNSPPHKFVFMEGECEKCHITYQYPFKFRDNITALCNECHGSDNVLSHIVGIVPSMFIADEFPLDEDGKMTCNTCHNIHMKRIDPVTGKKSYLLRLNLRGKEFCDACHLDTMEVLMPDMTPSHVETLGSAHLGYYTTHHSPVDDVSRYCISCHSGDIASMGHFVLKAGNPVWGSHPIGIDYKEAYIKSFNNPSNKMAAPEDIISEIKFIEGKMGCPSCHDPYNMQGHKLSRTNDSSRLCIACHTL